MTRTRKAKAKRKNVLNTSRHQSMCSTAGGGVSDEQAARQWDRIIRCRYCQSKNLSESQIQSLLKEAPLHEASLLRIEKGDWHNHLLHFAQFHVQRCNGPQKPRIRRQSFEVLRVLFAKLDEALEIPRALARQKRSMEETTVVHDTQKKKNAPKDPTFARNLTNQDSTSTQETGPHSNSSKQVDTERSGAGNHRGYAIAAKPAAKNPMVSNARTTGPSALGRGRHATLPAWMTRESTVGTSAAATSAGGDSTHHLTAGSNNATSQAAHKSKPDAPQLSEAQNRKRRREEENATDVDHPTKQTASMGSHSLPNHEDTSSNRQPSRVANRKQAPTSALDWSPLQPTKKKKVQEETAPLPSASYPHDIGKQGDPIPKKKRRNSNQPSTDTAASQKSTVHEMNAPREMITKKPPTVNQPATTAVASRNPTTPYPNAHSDKIPPKRPNGTLSNQPANSADTFKRSVDQASKSVPLRSNWGGKVSSNTYKKKPDKTSDVDPLKVHGRDAPSDWGAARSSNSHTRTSASVPVAATWGAKGSPETNKKKTGSRFDVAPSNVHGSNAASDMRNARSNSSHTKTSTSVSVGSTLGAKGSSNATKKTAGTHVDVAASKVHGSHAPSDLRDARSNSSHAKTSTTVYVGSSLGTKGPSNANKKTADAYQAVAASKAHVGSSCNTVGVASAGSSDQVSSLPSSSTVTRQPPKYTQYSSLVRKGTAGPVTTSSAVRSDGRQHESSTRRSDIISQAKHWATEYTKSAPSAARAGRSNSTVAPLSMGLRDIEPSQLNSVQGDMSKGMSQGSARTSSVSKFTRNSDKLRTKTQHQRILENYNDLRQGKGKVHVHVISDDLKNPYAAYVASNRPAGRNAMTVDINQRALSFNEFHDTILRLYNWEPQWQIDWVAQVSATSKVDDTRDKATTSAAQLRVSLDDPTWCNRGKEAYPKVNSATWGNSEKTHIQANEHRLVLIAIPLTPNKKKRADTHLWPKGTFVQITAGYRGRATPIRIVQRKQQSHDLKEWKGYVCLAFVSCILPCFIRNSS